MNSRFAPAELLAKPLEGGSVPHTDLAAEYRMRWSDGTVTPVAVDRWLAEPVAEDLELLDHATSPVLDIGCGPGRHLMALQRLGMRAVGIDILPEFVEAARRKGATVHEVSVFEPLPDEGVWATVLLLDGNVGIAGDPTVLLSRAREILRPGGRALIELEPPGVGLRRAQGQLESPYGDSRPFSWGRVGADAVASLACAAAFDVAAMWQSGARWFARLDALPRPASVGRADALCARF